MASPQQQPKKFTTQQIDHFNDRIENWLLDATCRRQFEVFLREKNEKLLLKALKLWTYANDEGQTLDDDTMYDLIDEVDGFNENPLLSIAEQPHKRAYIKGECGRILSRIHSLFIAYLRKYCVK